jgi:pyrroloquinoline quinone biosynthesis protein B
MRARPRYSSILCFLACGLSVLLSCAPPPTGDRSTEPAPSLTEPFLRILGTAQDGGLPHAACSCNRCERARRDTAYRRWVASAGIVIPAEDLRFLIDATPDIRGQLHALAQDGEPPPERTDRQPVDGVLLTHAHIGHYLGLAFFGFEAAHTRRIPVYCSPSLAAYLAANGPWDQLVRLENIVLKEVSHDQTFRLHEQVEVTVVPVPHRDEYADTVGFLIHGPRRTMLYVPDTEGWDAWEPPLTERLEGVDVAILDGTFYSPDELPGRDLSSIGHPLIVDSMDLLQPLVDAGRLEVWFTHLNHSNPALDPEGTEMDTIRERGFGVAQDGQEFPL